jgi:hypothetical protein
MPASNATRRVLPLEMNSNIPETDGSPVKLDQSIDDACHNSLESHEGDRIAGNSLGDFVPEDNNSENNSDELLSQTPHLQQPRRSSLRSADRQRDSRRSVRFSTVQTRVFETMENNKPEMDGLSVTPPQVSHELENEVIIDDNDDELVTQRNSPDLVWRFTDSVNDVETHEQELEEERNAEYTRMIQDHIQRVERERRERELNNQRVEKKGFKSKYLKPLWKGFIEATSRSAFMISPTRL